VEKGQSKSVSFTPTQAGSLTFFCTVHGQAAMSGTLTVN
jgi:plastocyanin